MIDHLLKRVMLDTNVLFSAMYKLESKSFDAFSIASKKPYRLVLCDQIIDELRRIFYRKFPLKIPAIEQFLLNTHYELITLASTDEADDDEETICDADDRPILRAARKAKVDIFITGDKDFLNSSVTNPKIFTTANFIELELNV